MADCSRFVDTQFFPLPERSLYSAIIKMFSVNFGMFQLPPPFVICALFTFISTCPGDPPAERLVTALS